MLDWALSGLDGLSHGPVWVRPGTLPHRGREGAGVPPQGGKEQGCAVPGRGRSWGTPLRQGEERPSDGDWNRRASECSPVWYGRLGRKR